ncbi:MAG: hypothetical protein J6X45_05250, partial [Lachnospiraceae bacterium]|nr:hypothetical protein [Lachnospiraceae bacterium]
AEDAGGIAGKNYGTISSCENNLKVVSTKNAGGIAGSSANATFITCKNFAEITGVDTAGGIMGAAESGATSFTLTDCVNTGKTTATANAGIAANVAGTVVFESCRNYGESAYAMTATDVTGLTYTISKCLAAGGQDGDHIANGATSDKLVRDFYLAGTSDKDSDGDPSIYDESQDNSSWAVNLKSVSGSIVFERGNVYYETGLSTTVDFNSAGYDRYALYQSIDTAFVSMANDTTNHPDTDTGTVRGFVKP